MLLFSSSGTGAFESAVANLTEPGEHALVVSSGHFGERWAAMATPYGADIDVVPLRLGRLPTLPTTAPAPREPRAPRSSTPRPRPGSSPTCGARRREETGALVVVDAVSSLGAVPCETDAWGLDVVVSGSQKALMTPPGTRPRGRLRESAGRHGLLASLLLRLGADAQGAGEARRAVHAGRAARARARRRARAAARGRPRRRLRAPRPARPGVPGGDQGDGPRAVLAGRGPQRGRDRRPRARGHRLRRRDPRRSRPASGSRSRTARAS